MSTIKYRAGYKFQLAEPYSVPVGVVPKGAGGNTFVSLDAAGTLHIANGYAWDGASGPAVDTSNSIRGSLVHDALYQLIREGVLTPADREAADYVLLRTLREDGMSTVRSALWFQAVRMFGGAYMAATGGNPVLEAP